MLEVEAVSLSRSIVQQICPEDLEDFEDIARYQTSGHASAKPGVGLSLELGIAGSSLLVLLVPVLEKALVQLAERLSAIGIDAAARTLCKWLAGEPTSTALSKAQRDDLIGQTVEFGRENGLTELACHSLRGLLEQKLPVRA